MNLICCAGATKLPTNPLKVFPFFLCQLMLAPFPSMILAQFRPLLSLAKRLYTHIYKIRNNSNNTHSHKHTNFWINYPPWYRLGANYCDSFIELLVEKVEVKLILKLNSIVLHSTRMNFGHKFM